jgi:HEAT repeat protein
VSDNNEFSKLWESFSDTQRQFCVARSSCTSDAQAAKGIGISPSTARNWPKKKEVDRAIYLMISDRKDSAMVMLQAGLGRAVDVLLAGLSDKSPRIRQIAAQDLLDRVQGRSIQRVAPIEIEGNTPYNPGVAPELSEAAINRINEILQGAHKRQLAAQVQVTDVTSEYLNSPDKDNEAQ